MATVQMATRVKSVAIGVALAAVLVLGAGCSSDDSSSSGTTTTSQGPSGSVNPEYETWCTSVKNLVEQSSPGDLSQLGDLAAFDQAIQSLASTAPEPIQSDMQTLATATDTKLQAVQADPSATLPPAMADEARAANDAVATFVASNCGVQLPTIDL